MDRGNFTFAASASSRRGTKLMTNTPSERKAPTIKDALYAHDRPPIALTALFGDTNFATVTSAYIVTSKRIDGIPIVRDVTVLLCGMSVT
jgi:hypothetical protein